MRWLPGLLLVLLALSTLWFVEHAMMRPIRALNGDPSARGYLFHPGAALSNVAIFGHMATGALITLAVPLQVLPVIRQRWPALHRASGKVLIGAAMLTAIGGLVYIALNGTIGGPWMSVWFGLYGLLMMAAAAQTLRFARARNFTRHRRWALRLLVLAVASYLYRVHYGLWQAFMGDLGVAADFSGTFDRANVWAFFLPYLVALELAFLAGRRRQRVSLPPQAGGLRH